MRLAIDNSIDINLNVENRQMYESSRWRREACIRFASDIWSRAKEGTLRFATLGWWGGIAPHESGQQGGDREKV
jgi:hypothetical protein